MSTEIETAQGTSVIDYNLTDQAIIALGLKYLKLEVTDIEDAEQVAIVKEARLDIKGRRVKVENKRKELKAASLAHGKRVDGAANHIFSLLEPIETHLKTEEGKVEAELQRIKDAEAARQKEIVDEHVAQMIAVHGPAEYLTIAAMTDEEFDTALFDATDDWNEAVRVREEQEEAQKDEADRLAKQKEEQEEEKERIETGQRRIGILAGLGAELPLADMMAMTVDEFNATYNIAKVEHGIEQGRKAKEESDQAAVKATLDRERKAFEKQRQAFADAEAKKEAEETARAQAESDAKEEADRKALEEKESKERQAADAEREEALRPDREKLLAFISGYEKAIADLKLPVLSDAAATHAMETISISITGNIRFMRDTVGVIE